ncbi:Ribosomal RNA processing protein 1 B [Thoreauomyces humboldtii]|nr:Ribosomal RNA processing protein 1 B [Thoreauomyces humboldtii]
MSDKPMIQEHLADKLAAMSISLPKAMAVRYVQAFWTTILSEWHGIDRLRLDKFYMLLRKFHLYGFRMLAANDWDSELVERYLSIITNGPLRLNDLKVADGLRYHTAEAYLEELQRAVGEGSVPTEASMAILEPFFANLSHSASDVVFTRVCDNVFNKILDQKSRTEDELDEPGSLRLPFDHQAIGLRLFAMATGSDILVKNRPKVTDLYKRWAKVVDMDVDSKLVKSKPVLLKVKKAPKGKKAQVVKEEKMEEEEDEEQKGDDEMWSDVNDEDEENVPVATKATPVAPLKRKAIVREDDEELAAAAAPQKKKKKAKKSKKAKNADGEGAGDEVSSDAVDAMEVSEAVAPGGVVVSVSIEDILAQTSQSDLLDLLEEAKPEAASPPVQTRKQKRALVAAASQTQPAKEATQSVTVVNGESDSAKKSVKFVLEQNMIKRFLKRDPIATAGTPTRKTNTAARKVLKLTPVVTPVSPKAKATASASSSQSVPTPSPTNGRKSKKQTSRA